jgi:hypothetical protein
VLVNFQLEYWDWMNDHGLSRLQPMIGLCQHAAVQYLLQHNIIGNSVGELPTQVSGLDG